MRKSCSREQEEILASAVPLQAANGMKCPAEPWLANLDSGVFRGLLEGCVSGQELRMSPSSEVT